MVRTLTGSRSHGLRDGDRLGIGAAGGLSIATTGSSIVSIVSGKVSVATVNASGV